VEALPLLAHGKLDRLTVRELAAGGLPRQPSALD
jgi:hypothetical protein